MIKNHFFKYIVPVVCSLSMVHGVIPKDSILDANDSSLENIRPFLNYNYKGIHNINQYGWYITQKWNTELKHVEIKDKWYEVKKYSPHPHLPFALFKVDKENDHQRNQLQKLICLADKEDLESKANWVISLAFIPDRFAHEGRISNSREDYTKPLSVISKVENQEKGFLSLTSGGSVDGFYSELWHKLKQEHISKYLKQADHINSLFENQVYQENYLRENISQLAQRKIKDLIKERESFNHHYINHFCSYFNYLCDKKEQQENKNYINQCPFLLKLASKISVLQSPESTLEKEHLLQEDMRTLWEGHKWQLRLERDENLKKKNILESLSDNYASLSSVYQRTAKLSVAQSLMTNHLGIADKEDQGGLILLCSKDIHIYENRYIFIPKIAGITCESDKSVEGERSVAVDLTTKEVRDWISDTIDNYYNLQVKRAAADEAGPSDRSKRPRIKEEPIDNDLALNPNVQVKEEIKEEVKEEN